MSSWFPRLVTLASVAVTLLVGTGCAQLSDDPWWFQELVPDSPCYRVNLLDGVDETSTTELHDLFACVDQGGLIAPLEPLDADIDFDTRGGDPIGVELARVLNHLPDVDIDPFALGDVLLDALNAEDRPVDEILATLTESLYGWLTAEVEQGWRDRDDPEALDAGLLAPLRPVVPVTATALLLDQTGALDFAADTLADPETEDWVRTVDAVLTTEDRQVSVPLEELLPDVGELLRQTRNPSNDRWEAASGDSLRDVTDFFVVRDNPVVDEISPAVAEMLGDDVVLDALVPMIDDLAAENHLVPLPPEVGWLASVDTDGSPLLPGELSSLTRFVRLLADNNHPVDCHILFFEWQLPNLSVATLEIIADMEPGEVQDFASVIESLTGNVVSDLAFEAALATCPTVSPTAYDDLQVLETLQEPETYDVLVAFVDLLNVLKHGQVDHLPDFADMAEALYDAGGLEPGEELIRDVALTRALTDVLTLLPVLVHPEEHGITAGSQPANDLADLLEIVRWFFVVDPENGLTGFQRSRPWMAPALGEDGTWVVVGNVSQTLLVPDSQLSHTLDLVPELLALDPDLVVLGELTTLLRDDELSLPILRILERPELVDDALASDPPPDVVEEVPLAFAGRLLLTGAVEDLLSLVDLILGSVPGSTTSSP